MSDRYDRIYGQVVDLAPMARPSTVIEALPIAGDVTTWVVQVAYHNEETVAFLQSIDAEGQLRLVLPPKVLARLISQDAAIRARVNDRRSEETRKLQRERARVAEAKRVLERKREERRARRAAGGAA